MNLCGELPQLTLQTATFSLIHMYVCVPPTLLTAIRNFNLTCNVATIITYLTCCAVCNVHLHFATLHSRSKPPPSVMSPVTCLLVLLSLDCCLFMYFFLFVFCCYLRNCEIATLQQNVNVVLLLFLLLYSEF